jgi:hypothetical protein
MIDTRSVFVVHYDQFGGKDVPDYNKSALGIMDMDHCGLSAEVALYACQQVFHSGEQCWLDVRDFVVDRLKKAWEKGGK